jgi:hypothetical protein
LQRRSWLRRPFLSLGLLVELLLDLLLAPAVAEVTAGRSAHGSPFLS